MKKVICLALVVLLLCSGCAAGGTSSGEGQNEERTSSATAGDAASKEVSEEETKGESNASGEIQKLVVTCRTFGSAPNDTAKVQEAINKITREKIGVEIELVIIQSGSYAQQMTLMLSGDEAVDCMGATRVVFAAAYNNDQLRPLEPLLESNGQGILKEIDADYLKAGKMDGTLYGITTNRDHARGYGGWMLRKDILEKHNIDTGDVDSFEDLTAVFAAVHEKEPDMIMAAPATVGQSFLQHHVDFDNLGDYFGVLLNHGEALVVEDLFTSDQYKTYLDTVRGWYESGYISKDVVNATEAGASLMKAGNLFAYPTAGKPGIERQESTSTGYDGTYVQVMETFTSTAAPQTWQWTIPQNSTNPEKAMAFLNLMYTDPDIMNLISWGIEGEHYEVKDEGTIGFPEGIDASNSGYNLNMTWQFGNEYIAHVWEGNDLDIWEQTAQWNTTGKFSKAMGFSFNNAPVGNEVAAVQNAYDEFRMGLECGVLDPDEALPQMNEKLEKAGLSTIMEEKQKQLDAWAQAEGIS